MLLLQKGFEKILKSKLGSNLEVVWTQNQRLMISYKKKKGQLKLRLHEAFQMASASLQQELLSYLLHSKQRVPASIKEFISRIPPSKKPKRVAKIKTAGEVHDLRKISARLNRQYFGGKLRCNITWGRRIFRKQRSILFGSYSPAQDLTRIHPILDTGDVPLFFIESIVHHELIHEHIHKFEPKAAMPMHGSRFKELEANFTEHDEAVRWQKKHLQMLLNKKA